MTGDFQVGGFDGYYLQDAGDGERRDVRRHLRLRARPASTSPPATRCTSRGTVSEFFGMTEITATADAGLRHRRELPAATGITLPVPRPTSMSRSRACA